MPAWNGRAGSGPAGSPVVPLALGVVDLVGVLGISHCPLENDLYFTSFSFPSFVTWWAVVLSVKIFQVVRFLWSKFGMWWCLDGRVRWYGLWRFIYIFFLLSVSKCSFLTIDCGFGLSFSLFCFSFTSHWEPGELEPISAEVPAELEWEKQLFVCIRAVRQWDTVQTQSLNICYLFSVSTCSKSTATIQNSIFKTLEEMNHPGISQNGRRLLQRALTPWGLSLLSGCLLWQCLWFLHTKAWILLEMR